MPISEGPEAESNAKSDNASGRINLSLAPIFAILCLGAAVNATAPSLLDQVRAQQYQWFANPDLGVSKIVVICILIGIWKSTFGLNVAARPLHAVLLLPAVLGTIGISGNAAWTGLAISAAAFLVASPWPNDSRGGLWIILLGALHAPGTSLLGQVIGGSLLALDQLVTVSVLSLFDTVEPLRGNVILKTGGEAIVLVWECGVFKNITLVVLLWLTMLQLLIGPSNRVPLADAMLLVAFCIALNTVRLLLMAVDTDWFDFMHQGPGAYTFRLLLLTAPMVMAWSRASLARA